MFKLHLVRNLDLQAGRRTRQSATGIYTYRHPHRLNQDLLERALSDIDARRVDAFLVHLSEGTDEESREEFYDLNEFRREADERCGPLMENTVVIHGTSYRTQEFELMSHCETDLVAAPLSNLLYYAHAPNLAEAVEAGVKVSLSTDWSPAGSKNLLMELKVADFLNTHSYGERLTDADLVRMVTSNPADAIGWSERVGRLKVGLWGDLLVLDSTHDDPYRTLIEATERDVALVVVGGDPIYGDVSFMQALKPGDNEVVDTGCGFQKAIDVTTDSRRVDGGRQTLDEIQEALRSGFQALVVCPKNNFALPNLL